MSLISPSRCWPLLLIVFRNSVRVSSPKCPSPSSISSSLKPRMALSGVRSSWLMLARNSLLTWLARSNFVLAALSSLKSWLTLSPAAMPGTMMSASSDSTLVKGVSPARRTTLMTPIVCPPLIIGTTRAGPSSSSRAQARIEGAQRWSRRSVTTGASVAIATRPGESASSPSLGSKLETEL